MKENLQGRILDIGCGYGVVGIVLKSTFPDIQAVCSDVNPRAVELAGINSSKNHAPIETAVSDRFANLTGMFDTVVSNPPIRAGKKVIYAMFQESYDHLSANGTLIAVVRRTQGAESAQKYIAEVFGNCDVISRDRGYWVLKGVRI